MKAHAASAATTAAPESVALMQPVRPRDEQATCEALDDWDLLARADQREALAILFARHRDYVFRLAWSTASDPALAEDVVQDVFLRLAQGFRRWRPRAAFRTWLFRVVRNTARELERRERSGRRRELPDAIAEGPTVVPWDPRRADLRAALAGLPERQRQTVVLRCLEGFTIRETARAMRCRPGTVKAHLHRALDALRTTLADPRDRPCETGDPT